MLALLATILLAWNPTVILDCVEPAFNDFEDELLILSDDNLTVKTVIPQKTPWEACSWGRKGQEFFGFIVQNFWAVTELQSAVFISQASKEFGKSSLSTWLFGRVLDRRGFSFISEISNAFDKVFFGLKVMFSLDFLEMNLSLFLFICIPKLHFHNNPRKSIILISKMHMPLTPPIQMLSQRPSLPAITCTMIHNSNLQPKRLQWRDFPNTLLIQKWQLIRFKLI